MVVAEERMGWEQQDVAKKTISMYAQSQAVTQQRLKPPTMPCGIFQAGMDSERKEMKQMASLQKRREEMVIAGKKSCWKCVGLFLNSVFNFN